MADNWVEEFGFSKNPYSIHPLTSEEGDRLLVGREEESGLLSQRILVHAGVPVLTGDFGVGKTSIANVVAYRLSKKYKDGNKRYFVLKLDRAVTSDLKDAEKFEKNVLVEILRILLEYKRFLIDRKISMFQIRGVEELLQSMIYKGGSFNVGPIGAGGESIPNPRAEANLLSIALEWLKKCFVNQPYGGGIICIIDNIEINGTANEIQSILERFRDTIFGIAGISWIVCGTQTSLSKSIKSSRMAGYLSPQHIEPIDVEVAQELIFRRINEYRRTDINLSIDPPVGQREFEHLYRVVHVQLRIALMICEEFAEYLYQYPSMRQSDRYGVFIRWLNQKASELPKGEYNIQEESWKLFKSITDIGSDVSNSDYWILGCRDAEELEKLAAPLKSKGLLESIDSDGGYMLRVTRDGWLVRYRRDGCKVQGE